MIGMNTEFWWFNLFSNFNMLMFITLIFTFFIINIIERITKKENIFKSLIKGFAIIQFVFFGITVYVNSTINSHRSYVIVTVLLIIVYILINLYYYILKEKGIRENKR